MSAKGMDLGLTLRSGEVIEFSEPRWFWSAKFIAVFGLLTFGFGWLLFIPRWFYRRSWLTITNQRVIAVRGIIIRDQQVFERSRVQNLAIRQGPIGSALDYGDVLIETAGNSSAVVIKGIHNPRQARTVAQSVAVPA